MLPLTELTEGTEKGLNQDKATVTIKAMFFTTLRRVSLAQGRQSYGGKGENLSQGKATVAIKAMFYTTERENLRKA